MSEPVLLGDLMKDYLINSDDDYAKAFRELYKEHGKDIVELFNTDGNGENESSR